MNQKVLDVLPRYKREGRAQPFNKNLVQFLLGYRCRLEIKTANLARCEPQFTKTKTEARTRKRQLRESGYSVTIFNITPEGGLTT